jgi:hypothetical protein
MVGETIDLIPTADVMEHQTGPGCICGPHVVLFERRNGSIGHYYMHHSLDGREHDEDDHDRESYPLCAERV